MLEFNEIKNPKLGKQIMALIENRHAIIRLGYYPYTVFYLGDLQIQLGLHDIMVGDTKFALKSKKAKKDKVE